MSSLAQLGVRAFRHLFRDRSYERYYSNQVWDRKYQEGFDLGGNQEDGRYGALSAIMLRYERGGPILDAGCGDGLLELQYRRISPVRLVGIDYSEAAIQAARQRALPDCDFFCQDYRDFTPEERFPVIVFNEALYYIDDYPALLERFSKYLAADGVLVVSMFDTLVTSRIWKALAKPYRAVQGVEIRDEGSGRLWRIRVLQPAGATPSARAARV